jgi:hypothetical protein
MGVLKEQGTWAWELKPLLDEYVFALRAAEATRDGFAWLEALERYADDNASDMPEIAWTTLREIASGLPTQWDRHTKRAAALADQLLLTSRGRKAADRVSKRDDKPADPFEALDELAPRRADRAQAS